MGSSAYFKLGSKWTTTRFTFYLFDKTYRKKSPVTPSLQCCLLVSQAYETWASSHFSSVKQQSLHKTFWSEAKHIHFLKHRCFYSGHPFHGKLPYTSREIYISAHHYEDWTHFLLSTNPIQQKAYGVEFALQLSLNQTCTYLQRLSIIVIIIWVIWITDTNPSTNTQSTDIKPLHIENDSFVVTNDDQEFWVQQNDTLIMLMTV